jgi:hypothetical protein
VAGRKFFCNRAVVPWRIAGHLEYLRGLPGTYGVVWVGNGGILWLALPNLHANSLRFAAANREAGNYRFAPAAYRFHSGKHGIV